MKTIIEQDVYFIGDEWLYYKIYYGKKASDIILTDLVGPLAKLLLDDNQISKWFFIRYSDPEQHLRVRFKICKVNDIGKIILTVHKKITPFIENKLVWDVQLATYSREIDRYGSNTMELSETLFFYDSISVLEIINYAHDEEHRFLMILKRIENTLILFGFRNRKLLLFLDQMQLQFKEEFNIKRIAKKQLSDKFREMTLKLSDTSQNESLKGTHAKDMRKVVAKMLVFDSEKKLEISLESLLASFIHMTINRSFKSKQRLYEMMIYDFLYRKHKSKYARYGKT